MNPPRLPAASYFSTGPHRHTLGGTTLNTISYRNPNGDLCRPYRIHTNTHTKRKPHAHTHTHLHTHTPTHAFTNKHTCLKEHIWKKEIKGVKDGALTEADECRTATTQSDPRQRPRVPPYRPVNHLHYSHEPPACVSEVWSSPPVHPIILPQGIHRSQPEGHGEFADGPCKTNRIQKQLCPAWCRDNSFSTGSDRVAAHRIRDGQGFLGTFSNLTDCTHRS